jgi:hypothetical protein
VLHCLLVGHEHVHGVEVPLLGRLMIDARGFTRQEGCLVCHSCGYSKLANHTVKP